MIKTGNDCITAVRLSLTCKRGEKVMEIPADYKYFVEQIYIYIFSKTFVIS